jgi:UDP-glucose 4-epimerase
MKNILITGANSYIGTSFERWIMQNPDKYTVEKISIRDDRWRKSSFEGYDVVFHTAAIVHENENDVDKYFKINRDLTIDVAKKAKQEGVKQFIFLSTMGVYGVETGYITASTLPKPKTHYAKSKYEAEQALKEIQAPGFKIAILRPPLVYGKDCPGNYTRLANMALKLPFFPDMKNARSMIYIDNLSEFIKIVVDQNVGGIYKPQNQDYVKTTELVMLISQAHGKDIKITKAFNWAVSILLMISGTFRKVFGSFIYEKEDLDECFFWTNEYINYETISFEESIIRTEMK